MLGKAGRWPWENLREYRIEAGREGIANNQGAFIGHGNLRINSMGFAERRPTGKEMEEMKRLLAEELAEGAFGLTSGPVSYTHLDVYKRQDFRDLCPDVYDCGHFSGGHSGGLPDGGWADQQYNTNLALSGDNFKLRAGIRRQGQDLSLIHI